MELITYKTFEWYVMSENSKEKLLLLKDSLTNEMVRKYFDRYSNNFNVQFNQNNSKIWWKDSYIREFLNEKFVLDLDIKDLNIMSTTLMLNGITSTTEDYVRLLTIKEARRIKNKEESVLYTDREWGYWTMSPDDYYLGHAYVFGVSGSDNPGYIVHGSVNYWCGVRPVISLKSNTISDEEFKREFSKYLSL